MYGFGILIGILIVFSCIVTTPDLAVVIGGVKHWVDVTVRVNGAPTYSRLTPKALLARGERDKANHYKDVRFDGFYCTFAVDVFGNLGVQAEIFLKLMATNSNNDKLFIANFKRSLSVWLAKIVSNSIFCYLSECVPSVVNQV